MACKFKVGDKVIVRSNAERAYRHIGEKAEVVEVNLSGFGNNKDIPPLKTDNVCVVTLEFKDGTRLTEVPEESLDFSTD